MRSVNRPYTLRPIAWLASALSLWTFAATGCSSEQIYNAAQGWRRNECYKIVDLGQRDRCLAEADRPYDTYRAGSGATR